MREELPRIKPHKAPKNWANYCWHEENKLHQLSPYIGKLKSSIAADLIDSYTRPGDVVLDPFCGSGTISLECALRGRMAIAADVNIYAYVLAMAKLYPPKSLATGIRQLERTLAASQTRREPDLRTVPRWVRKFFHPETLRETIMFADECLAQNSFFLLACLAGILHHQRPGFLSFPSSHLVPYLRERKFPRHKFPKLYAQRELQPRMLKKIRRALEDEESLRAVRGARATVHRTGVGQLQLTRTVDAIITSPPYMNALDYVRDNRLRMWFLDRSTANYSPEPTDHRANFEKTTRALVRTSIARLRPNGHCVLVVGETVRRKRMQSHPAELVLEWLKELAPQLTLEQVLEDVIPDVRRSRRTGAATKKELILVLRRRARK